MTSAGANAAARRCTAWMARIAIDAGAREALPEEIDQIASVAASGVGTRGRRSIGLKI
jgi:hypothetical protein